MSNHTGTRYTNIQELLYGAQHCIRHYSCYLMWNCFPAQCHAAARRPLTRNMPVSSRQNSLEFTRFSCRLTYCTVCKSAHHCATHGVIDLQLSRSGSPFRLTYCTYYSSELRLPRVLVLARSRPSRQVLRTLKGAAAAEYSSGGGARHPPTSGEEP